METPGNEGLPTSKTDSKGKEEINIWLTARRLFQFGRRLIQDFELHLDDGFRIICPGTSGLLINAHSRTLQMSYLVLCH